MKPPQITTILFFILVVTLPTFMIGIHEYTHYHIYQTYGINSTYEFFQGEAFVSVVPNETQWNNTSLLDLHELRILQLETEMIGYILFPIFLVIFTIMVILYTFVTKYNVQSDGDDVARNNPAADR